MGIESPVLDKLRTERDQHRAAATAIAESDNFNPEDENYQELKTRAAQLDNRISELANLLQAQANADQLDGKLSKAAARREQDSKAPQTRGSWGDLFTRSDIFTEYGGRGRSSRFEIDDLETRALPTGISDLVAAGLTLGKTSIDLTPPQLPTPLLDAISTVNVSSNAIEYVSWSVVAGGPDIVPEKGAKPSIEYGPTVSADTLDMIAVYTQLTRQLLEDAASVRSMIDTDLRRQIVLKEEAEAADVLATATLPTASAASLLAAIRFGIATVQGEGYAPNAFLVNPNDWADLDIAVMDSTVDGPTRRAGFWGLTPIPSPTQPEGQVVVGDFRTAVNHYVRSQVSLYITDSHAATFLSNVFTLLAERRSKTAVIRPQALVRVSGTAS